MEGERNRQSPAGRVPASRKVTPGSGRDGIARSLLLLTGLVVAAALLIACRSGLGEEPPPGDGKDAPARASPPEPTPTFSDLMKEGRSLEDLGTPEGHRQAIAKYLEAARIAEEMKDHRRLGQALRTIAYNYQDLDDRSAALEYFTKALKPLHAAGDRAGESETLSQLGTMHALQHDKDTAMPFLEKALKVLDEVKKPDSEAAVRAQVGACLFILGEQERALAELKAALPLWSPENRAEIAQTLNGLAGVYLAVGKLKDAAECFRRAGELASTSPPSGSDKERWRVHAHELHSQAMGYLLRGDPELVSKAVAYLRMALRVFQEQGDKQMEALTFKGLGTAYTMQGDRESALDALRRAVSFQETLNQPLTLAVTLCALGEACWRFQDPQGALDAHTRALSICEKLKLQSGQAVSLSALARIEEERDLLGASGHALAALKQIESLRSDVLNQHLRMTYTAKVHDYYEHAVDLLMRLHERDPGKGYEVSARDVAERGRARGLLDLLTHAGVDVGSACDPVLLEKERKLHEDINRWELARQDSLFEGRDAQAVEDQFTRKIDEALAKLDEVQAQIQRSSPRYANLTHPEPVPLRRVQKDLLDEDTLLLEYALGDRRSYLWAIASDGIQAFSLEKREVVEAAARRFYELLRESRDAGRGQDLEDAAAKLSGVILRPEIGALGKRRLLIAKDGILNYIPFCALPLPGLVPGPDHGSTASPAPGSVRAPLPESPRPPLLVDRYEIVSLGSASALALSRQAQSGRERAPRALAMLSDPVYSGDDPRLPRRSDKADDPSLPRGSDKASPKPSKQAAAASSGPDLARLVFSGRLAQSIVPLLSPAESLDAGGFACNLQLVTGAELGRYRLVHFDAHGTFDTERPELSAIVLSLRDEDGRKREGYLRLHDTYNLRLCADLVVLSACETALGREYRGEGLVGLTRGFLHAGAKSVLASLWRVDDEATSELMRRFYGKLLGEERLHPAAALRGAQLEVRAVKRWESPYYWAGFVLQGDWR